MKIINKIIAFVMLFSLIGCESFLNLEPENKLIQSDFWKTEADVKSVMMSSYITLRKAHLELFDWGEMRSDGLDINVVQGDLGAWVKARRGEILENFKPAKWSSMYTMIGYSNLLLENISAVVELDPEFYPAEAKAYVAEAKTLRALAYFYLLRTFREVPLVLDAYETDGKEIQVAKSSEEVIIAQIIKDLKDAIPDMRSNYDSQWQVYGRATKSLAETLLADVYLYNGDYQECVDMCNDVIANPFKTLIRQDEEEGESDDDITKNNKWLNIFFEGNTNESIFEIQFDGETEAQKNKFFSYFWHNESNPRLIPNPSTVNRLFEDTDIRRAIVWYEINLKGTEDEPVHYLLKYMGTRDSDGKAGNILMATSARHLIIYRLAEVYLMRAEANACLGNYDVALEDINEIRERAKASPASISASKNAFEDYILEERAREFMGEGKSWFDLLRIARRNNYERKEILIEKLLLNVAGVDRPVMENLLQEPNAYYLPIHKDELNLNKMLVQNPYYE